MKEKIKFVFTGIRLLYTIIIGVMCILYIIYPFRIKPIVYNYVHSLTQNSEVLTIVMVFSPLIWILLVGILASLFNTFFYCTIENDDKEGKWWRYILALCDCLFFAYGWHLVDNLFDNFQLLSTTNSLTLQSIQDLFCSFSTDVSYLSFAVFGFFSFIDIRDIITGRPKSKSQEGDDKKKDGANPEPNPDEKKEDNQSIDYEYSWLQLLLIDGTVLLCSIALTWYSTFLNSDKVYPEIFMTGAWGFQIIYSQFVFYILTMRYYRRIKS